MVLESGIPELVDIEELVSDYWVQAQRPWLVQNFSAVHNQAIYRIGLVLNVAQAGFSGLQSSIAQYNRVTVDYLRGSVVLALQAKIGLEAEATRATIQAHDPAGTIVAESEATRAQIAAYGPRFEQIWVETTRNAYLDAPGSETLRGMISKLRWEVTIGSQDRRTGLFSGIFGDLAAIPGSVARQLIGDFEDVRDKAIEATLNSQEALWGLFQETQAGIGEALTTIFGDVFKAGGPLGGIFAGIPMMVARMMMPAQDEVAGMFLTTLKTRSPANVKDLNSYIGSEADKQGFWPIVQGYKAASPDTVFDVAKKLKDNVGSQLIMVNMASVLAETLLPYESGISRAIPQLWETLIDAKDAIGSFTGPILEASLQEPMRQWALRKWLPSIPGPADLISMYVKEGFEPFKQLYVPEGFAANMRLHGYDESWTKAWWGAHWVLPPINLLYEFYHRFPEKFGLDKLKQYLRWHDYHPDEHAWLVEAAETLIPRIDLRRALDYGQLEFEDLTPMYKQHGYSDKNAGIMANIARRFALTSERSDRRKLHERRFLLDLESPEEVGQHLRNLEFGEDVVLERLAYLQLRKETEDVLRSEKISEEIRIKELTVSQLGRALKYGRIPESEYNDRLAEYGYSADDIRVLRERILEDPVVDAQEAMEREIVRTKTRTYRTLYAREAIPRGKLVTNLLAIGVAEELAFALADFEDARKVEIPEETETAEDKALARRIRQMKGSTAREQYRRWIIELNDLVDVLQGYGYNPEEAQAVGNYEAIRRPKAPVPTQVVEEEKERLEVMRLQGQTAIARFLDRIIDRSALEAELIAVGYDDEVARAKADLAEVRIPEPDLTEDEKALAKASARATRLRETAVRTLYRGWEITEDDLRSSLLGIPLDPSVTQGIVDLERARRPDQPIPPEEKERLKHVAEIRALSGKVVREKYRKAKISREELYSGLVQAGYAEDVAWLIKEYEAYHRLPKPK